MNNLIGFNNMSLYPNFGFLYKDSRSTLSDYMGLISIFKWFLIPDGSYDRFHNIPTLFDDKINWRYNLDGKCKKTFEEICIDRAKEIYDSHDKIFLGFTGGITSLTLLSTFVLNNQLDKLIILYDENIENKEILFDFFKKNNIKNYLFGYKDNMKSYSDTIKEHVSENEKFCIINGLCADYFEFGKCTALYTRQNVDDIIDEYNNTIFSPYENFFKEKKYSQLNIVNEWVSKFPFGDKIKSIRDLAWLFSFSVLWTHLETKHMFTYDKFMPYVHKPFFCTQEFTDWAINNLDEILENNYIWTRDGKNYKLKFKKIISKVFDDKFDNLQKENSSLYIRSRRRDRYIKDKVERDFNAHDAKKYKDIQTFLYYGDEYIYKNFATDGKRFYGLDFIEK